MPDSRALADSHDLATAKYNDSLGSSSRIHWPMARTRAWMAVQLDAESALVRCSRCFLNEPSWRMGYDELKQVKKASTSRFVVASAASEALSTRL